MSVPTWLDYFAVSTGGLAIAIHGSTCRGSGTIWSEDPYRLDDPERSDMVLTMALMKASMNLHKLVGGWTNPFEKYESNWIISPNKVENNTYLKLPHSKGLQFRCTFLFTNQKDPPILFDLSFTQFLKTTVIFSKTSKNNHRFKALFIVRQQIRNESIFCIMTHHAIIDVTRALSGQSLCHEKKAIKANNLNKTFTSKACVKTCFWQKWTSHPPTKNPPRNSPKSTIVFAIPFKKNGSHLNTPTV